MLRSWELQKQKGTAIFVRSKTGASTERKERTWHAVQHALILKIVILVCLEIRRPLVLAAALESVGPGGGADWAHPPAACFATSLMLGSSSGEEGC